MYDEHKELIQQLLECIRPEYWVRVFNHYSSDTETLTVLLKLVMDLEKDSNRPSFCFHCSDSLLEDILLDINLDIATTLKLRELVKLLSDEAQDNESEQLGKHSVVMTFENISE